MEQAEETLDMDNAVESIGRDLFGHDQTETETPPLEEAPDEDAVPEDAEEETGEPEPEEIEKEPEPVSATKAPPKSWVKEQHDRWNKIDPDTQAYIQQREEEMSQGVRQVYDQAQYGQSLRQVIDPFKQMIQSAGATEAQAIQYLLNANARLTTGPMEARIAAYRELGKNIGLLQGQEESAPTDPVLQSLQQRLNSLETSMTQREQTALAAATEKTRQEIEAFAEDPTHADIWNVGQDMIPWLQAGHSLQEAYDKAVWANDSTRQKALLQLQTEQEKKLKENARLNALKAKKAADANVRSRESQRTPTEPLGTMEDTMRDTYRQLVADDKT